jgi:diaminopimelate decarboxylase
MRTELPPHVADAIEHCERATLVFARDVLEANLRRVASAARAAQIRPLFAMKSFPHPEVRSLAAELLDGFDAASPGELRDVPPGALVSIADPSGAAIACAPRTGRVIAVCETVDQIRRAPALAEIAIRVSASITGRDPAIGAVLDGSGRRRSRFGLDTREEVAEVARAAAGRPLGLHVHHGPVVATSPERFVATAHAALALADFAPAFLDLGGAWHGVPDLAAAFAEVRAALPAGLELLVEPGRLYAEGAGFATGKVLARRALGDRTLVIGELSRVCHLRWSQVELVGRAPRPGVGHDVLVVGPTCYEEDVLGTWIAEPDQLGERITLRNVSGYALAWNAGFGGIPAADVVMI